MPKDNQGYEEFLEYLTESPDVSAAARKAGLTRRQVYARRKKDESFRLNWENCQQMGFDGLMDEAVRRALGFEVPYYDRQAKATTTKLEYSDKLLMMLLRVLYSDEYGDRDLNVAFQIADHGH